MKKIEFIILPQYGDRMANQTDDKYILLMYYLSERTSIDTIDRVVSELETVQRGEKTFEEVFTDVYGTMTINWNAGEFECDKETAYFISNHPDLEPSMEMPLQELIDLLKEWRIFRTPSNKKNEKN